MKLKVLGSSSSGNGYVLESSDGEYLLLECGIPFVNAQAAISFNVGKVVGALITHEHGDHAKHANKYMSAGISVFCSKGTADAIGNNRRIVVIKEMEKVKLGGFTVMPFNVQHDASEPFGYLIKHDEMGLMLFCTDTYYLKYRFEGLTQVLIECNYDGCILGENLRKGVIHPSVYKRTFTSHMSIDTCISTLKANDLSNVNRIVLLHLSGNNANPDEFVSRVSREVGKMCVVAKKGVELVIKKDFPF